MSDEDETTPSAKAPKPKRPADELKKAARDLTDLALQTLKAIMEGTGQDSVKLGAAREVLDRAHGKPKAAAKPPTKKPKTATDEGMTVVIRRFTDAPDPEAGEYEVRG